MTIDDYIVASILIVIILWVLLKMPPKGKCNHSGEATDWYLLRLVGLALVVCHIEAHHRDARRQQVAIEITRVPGLCAGLSA
jgi:hypothetical protein